MTTEVISVASTGSTQDFLLASGEYDVIYAGTFGGTSLSMEVQAILSNGSTEWVTVPNSTSTSATTFNYAAGGRPIRFTATGGTPDVSVNLSPVSTLR